MTASTTPAIANLGFLTILHEPSGYVGGYLVTNNWGRPLEFRLSTAVQPNRVQQVLYGTTLQPYICADVIGKTLVDKTGTLVQAIFTDREAVLDLRRSVDVPVAWVSTSAETPSEALRNSSAELRPGDADRGAVFRHPSYPDDSERLHDLLVRIEGLVDLSEPFSRIRDAIGEARKMGVTARG